MDEKEIKNNIPCVVDGGILYNTKDIQRVLRDLGHVTYSYIMDNEIKGTGEGYIMSVVANNSSANIIVNKRLYLNVNGFEYMNISTENNEAVIELVDNFRILRLVPMPNQMNEEMSPHDIILSQVSEYSEDDYDYESFVEINRDDDFDDE